MRSPLFVDTSYVVALASRGDEWHRSAVTWANRIEENGVRVITTEFVLTEIGDSLASMMRRTSAVAIIRALQLSASVEILPVSSELFDAALTLYASRIDKDWGLTDCTSFVVMTERGMEDALTVDRHFQQAGFRALLLEE